jgi:hypothetical protein
MLSLMSMRTSFSTAAGGGVRGMEDGIARGAMIQVGVTIEVAHLFTAVYPRIGRTITGRIAGEVINGISKEYLTMKFKKTGGVGKRISIGRNKTIGVSKIQGMTEMDQGSNSMSKSNSNSMSAMNNRATMKEEDIRKNDFSRKC